MRVVVLCAEPGAAREDPESIGNILGDLGCDVRLGRFDCGELDEEDLVQRPATLVLVDAGDELELSLIHI